MKLLKIVKEFKDKKVAVIGDVMLDQYIFGRVTQISPEAPVPLLTQEDEKFFVGGAGNVARNIMKLGGQSSIIGVCGDDWECSVVYNLLNGVKTYTYRQSNLRTTLKSRFLNGGVQWLRVDRDIKEIDPSIVSALAFELPARLSGSDAVIISDYGKGVYCHEVREVINDQKKRKPELKVILDPKPKNIPVYWGLSFDVMTPNLKEAQEMYGTYSCKAENLVDGLSRKFGCSVVITLGKDGYICIDHKTGVIYQNKALNENYVDVTGAGDTFNSALALALSCGVCLEDACKVANHASSIAVGKMGTSYVTPEELISVYYREEEKEIASRQEVS